MALRPVPLCRSGTQGAVRPVAARQGGQGRVHHLAAGQLAQAGIGGLFDRHAQRHAVLLELDDDQVQGDVAHILRLDTQHPADAVGRIDNVITFTVFALCHARLSPIGIRFGRKTPLRSCSRPKVLQRPIRAAVRGPWFTTRHRAGGLSPRGLWPTFGPSPAVRPARPSGPAYGRPPRNILAAASAVTESSRSGPEQTTAPLVRPQARCCGANFLVTNLSNWLWKKTSRKCEKLCFP